MKEMATILCLGTSGTGSEQLVAGSVEAGKSSQTSSSVAGVNRRTAVLFGNKTPRRSLQRTTTAQSPGALLDTILVNEKHTVQQLLLSDF